MVQLDGLCLLFSTVEDSRHASDTAHAAARTCSLQRARCCGDFYFLHFSLQLNSTIRDPQVLIKLYCMNSELTEASLLMRNMVSPRSSATLRQRMRLHFLAASLSGMVLVTTTSSST